MSTTKNTSKSKSSSTGTAQTLLDADLVLQAAADRFGTEDETDETRSALREAALAFADAWRACEGVS